MRLFTNIQDKWQNSLSGNVAGPGGSPYPRFPILNALTDNNNRTMRPATTLPGGCPIILMMHRSKSYTRPEEIERRTR